MQTVLLHQKHQQHPPTPSLSKLSELELVNDLLRSRVAQLEKTEAQARESEVSLRSQLNETESEISKVKRERDALRDSEAALRRQIVDVCEERDKLKTRINDLENKLQSQLTQEPQSPRGSQSEADLHRIKRIKVSDML
jgi:GATA-binding protein